jgi:hypothetical protein
MASTARHFITHSRGKFIRPIGMGLSQGVKRAFAPLKSTSQVLSTHLGISKGRGTLLLQEDLGATDLEGTGMVRKCGGGNCGRMCCGSGFGVKPNNPNLIKKLQSLSLKSVQGVASKRKNVGSVL